MLPPAARPPLDVGQPRSASCARARTPQRPVARSRSGCRPGGGAPPETCTSTVFKGASTESIIVTPVRIPGVFTQPSSLIAIGVGAAAVLTLLTYLVGRRTRTARQLPSRRPREEGFSLAAGRVPIDASLPETMNMLSRDRASGTLRVTSGEQAASLYFVFGKLFHAEKDNLEGEDALREVLTWRPVISTLDRRSALPAKETIKKTA